MLDVLTKKRVLLNISENLQRLMADCGLNQSDLAARAEVKQPLISRSLNAVGVPSVEVLARLASVLGVKVDDLIGNPSDSVAA